MGGGRCLPLMRTYLAAPLQSLSLSAPGHQSADILISIPPSLSLPLLYQFWSSFLPFLLFLPEVKYLCVSSPLLSPPLQEKRDSKMRGDHSLARRHIPVTLEELSQAKAALLSRLNTRVYAILSGSSVGKFSRASVHLAVERGGGGGAELQK